VLQAAPAPRFSATPSGVPGPVSRLGEQGAELLREAGMRQDEIEQLLQLQPAA
jgi:crotonobetainyl-CoA:carnitine CoA-transferase CaiB-like acyl-CoA transferase